LATSRTKRTTNHTAIRGVDYRMPTERQPRRRTEDWQPAVPQSDSPDSGPRVALRRPRRSNQEGKPQEQCPESSQSECFRKNGIQKATRKNSAIMIATRTAVGRVGDSSTTSSVTTENTQQ
jgi:hypothetical protein